MLGYASYETLRLAWRDHASLGLLFAIPLSLFAVLMLALAAWIVIAPLRRKLKTGKFLLSRTESARKAAENWSKYGAGKPLRPQIWLLLVPALLSLLPLWIASLLIQAIVCDCVPTRWGKGALILLIAVLIGCGLAYPFVLIRRKLRTGSFLPSQEELAKRRAKCAAPRPLRTRILMAGIWVFNATVWTYSAISHMHRPHSDWSSPLFTAGATWFAAAIWTWQVFRQQKSQCALPLDDAPLPPPQDGPRFSLLDE
jgi:hypothetical protein